MTRCIISPGELKRIPGLYRRWELLDILEAHRSYHIEQAGCDSDGTPLLALYGDFAAVSESGEGEIQPADRTRSSERALREDRYLTETELAERWRLSPRSLQRWRSKGTGPAFIRVGHRRVVYKLGDVETYERCQRAESHSLILGTWE
jgi:hypothetical protein